MGKKDKHAEFMQKYCKDNINTPIKILNKNNIYITKENIKEILRKVDVKYTPKDIEIFQRAFVHESYVERDFTGINIKDIDEINGTGETEDCIPLQKQSYERLEFLGDGILCKCVVIYLYTRYSSKEDEGFMSELKGRLVGGKYLCQLAKYLGFAKYFLISSFIEKNNNRNCDSILEDTFEAFIGALYLDASSKISEEDCKHDSYKKPCLACCAGFSTEICYKFIINTIEKTTDFADIIANDDNYKAQLNHYYHRKFCGINPKYYTIAENMSDGKKSYIIGINHPVNTDELIGKAEHREKKEAEKLAAKFALDNLKRNDNF